MIEIAISVFLFVLLAIAGRRNHLSILGTAYILRIALSYAQTFGVVLPDSQADAIVFERLAWTWARDGRFLDDFTTGAYLYSWLGSGVYTVFGRSALFLRVINSFFGTLIILYVMRTARYLVATRYYHVRIGWFLALYPPLLLYSALTMREVAVVLAFVMSIHFLVKWTSMGRLIHGAISTLFMAIAQLFHSGMVFGTIATMLIYLHGMIKRISARTVFRSALSLIGILGALVLAARFSFETGVGLEKVRGLVSGFDLEVLTRWQDYSSRGRAAYLSGVYADNWIDMSWQLPLRVLYLLGSPFVWMVTNMEDFLGFIDGTLFLYVVFRITTDVVKGDVLKNDKYRCIAFVLVAVLGTFALATSNYGTAFRHRAKVLPLLVLLYAYGRELKNRLGR